MNQNLLIIFIKYPAPGSVKQRLAAYLGAAQAAKIYKNIAQMVIEKTAPQLKEHYEVKIFFTPQEEEKLIKDWLINNNCFYPQQGSELGERMLNAFKHVFAKGYKRAVLIGSDCPDISKYIIMQSFELLHNKQVVMGPACDGGYYLIGLREAFPELFSNIEWGGEKVFVQTLDTINAAGLSLGLLPMLRDIDRVEDLQYYHLDL